MQRAPGKKNSFAVTLQGIILQGAALVINKHTRTHSWRITIRNGSLSSPVYLTTVMGKDETAAAMITYKMFNPAMNFCVLNISIYLLIV